MWLRNFINAQEGRLITIAPNGAVASDEAASDLRRSDGDAADITFAWQLRAFAAAVTEGAPFPTTADSAAVTMRVIDDAYRAAGLPPRGT